MLGQAVLVFIFVASTNSEISNFNFHFSNLKPEAFTPCPEGWHKRDGYCYRAFLNLMSWDDAESVCIGDNAHLVSVHSETENQFVCDLLKDTPLIIDGEVKRRRIWTGLHRNANGFVWSDKTPVDYLNWGQGEPNYQEEKCVEFRNFAHYWNDVGCWDKMPFVCKKRSFCIISFHSIVC